MSRATRFAAAATLAVAALSPLSLIAADAPATNVPKPAEKPAAAAEAPAAGKAVELFNGKDLTGWGYKTGEKFDGKTESADKRYTVKDGVLTVNPGKGINQLWTTAEFPGDFDLTLEFRAGEKADSGLFLRKPQLQVRDYLTVGPYKQLKKYKPQEWNQIVVHVRGNVAHCECNGEVLEAALKLPETGGIGLEADKGTMEYRNIRLTPAAAAAPAPAK